MNKKILSIFALIMAISILGVSCKENNTTDPTNGGGTTIVPPPQYPQSTIETTGVDKFVNALGAMGVLANGENQKTGVKIDLSSVASEEGIIGVYNIQSSGNKTALATGDDTDDVAALTASVTITPSKVLETIKAKIKTEVEKTDGSTVGGDNDIASVDYNAAYIHSQNAGEIVIAIPFKDKNNENGVIALPIVVKTGSTGANDRKIGNFYVDFSETAMNTTALDDTAVKGAIVTAFNGLSLGDAVTTQSLTVTADDVTLANGKITIDLTSGTDVDNATGNASKGAFLTGLNANYPTLVTALSALGLEIESLTFKDITDSPTANDGTVKFEKAKVTIGKGDTPTTITVTRKAGYAPAGTGATDVTTMLGGTGVTIEITATAFGENWGN